MDDERLRERLRVPNAQRLLLVGDAFRRGYGIEEIHRLTRIDRWFLRHIEEIVQEEGRIAAARFLMDIAGHDFFARSAFGWHET